MPKVDSKKKTVLWRTNQCSNPFNLPNHGKKKKSTLRKITKEQLRAWNLPVNDENLQMRVCISCRLRPSLPATSTVNEPSTSNANEESRPRQEAGPSYVDNVLPIDKSTEESVKSSDTSEEKKVRIISEVIIGVKKKGISFVGSSPIKMRKIHQKRYCKQKIDSISNTIKNKISHVFDEGSDNEDDEETFMLKVIQEKFTSTSDQTMKVKILTIVHQWSYLKIKEYFPTATRHMIKVAKTIAVQKGILEGPNPKSHPTLEENVINKIIAFYQSDEFSQIMPGVKDYVSVKIDGTRHHIQKRLLLNNLKELHRAFKESNNEVKCSFSKFASLRPKQCILAGASGTHSVCVCSIHENVKLLINGANFKRLTVDCPQPIQTYHDCLNKIICNPPSTNCYIGTCSTCPGTNDLIQELENIFDENYIDSVTYKQWTHVDRTTLQTVVSPVDEFLQILTDGLKKLLRPSYVVKKQNEFLNSKKENLKSNECIVILNFSENYAFVMQNAIQGIHWNNDQATVHPTVIYYKNEKNELKMKSLVSISECLNHDTIAVHLFQSKIVEFIKQNLPTVKKIIYFSDEASAQYKNRKNFINLSHHMQDFNIAAEWNFFPRSHGKGPCDGLGGTLKRLAARASLQRIDNPIQTPKELFLWATEALPNIHCNYFTTDQYNQEEKKLTPRFQL